MSESCELHEVADVIQEFVLWSAKTLVTGDPEVINEEESLLLASTDDEDPSSFTIVDTSGNVVKRLRIKVEVEELE